MNPLEVKDTFRLRSHGRRRCRRLLVSPHHSTERTSQWNVEAKRQLSHAEKNIKVKAISLVDSQMKHSRQISLDEQHTATPLSPLRNLST
jgi:hypothetical protein